jgi:hypothetical protein
VSQVEITDCRNYRNMPIAESDFKAEELDSIINVIGLKPSDPLDGFGGKSLLIFCK